jgi:hypothetical protein
MLGASDVRSAAGKIVVWRDEPTMRGSFGILSSCIFTLLLCSYAILHPAYRPWKDRPVRLSLAVYRMVGALLFPEFWVWSALRTRETAKFVTQCAEQYGVLTPARKKTVRPFLAHPSHPMSPTS